MTLTEYLRPDRKHERAYKVVLNIFEFKIHLKYKSGADTFTEISIPEIEEKYNCRRYILKNGEGFLYTTDENGNPTSKSCFYIEDLNPLYAVEDEENIHLKYLNWDNFLEKIPKETKIILDEMQKASEDGFDYIILADLAKRLEQTGFTFEYSLDAEPFNFRELTNYEKSCN